jgi:DNA-nicking Smr family endonuclease
MTSTRRKAHDHEEFLAAMEGVKPLRPVAAKPVARATAAPARPRPQPVVAPRPVHPPNPGIDRRTAERVRKGEMPIDARLDLHGMTQEAAHRALDRFIAHAVERGQRLVLVITGKGRLDSPGVLRDAVPRWLAAGAQGPRVLLSATAQPRHGGGGALYVYLRRRRASEASE